MQKNIHDEIAQVAYELFEKRGCVHGHELRDWLDAEKAVAARSAKGKEQGKTAKSTKPATAKRKSKTKKP
jgi:hypothetical protein